MQSIIRPRLSQLVHPPLAPAPATPAATLILLRDHPEGLQVLMTRRASSARFAPDAYVFPGGCLDAADAASHAVHAVAQCRPSQNAEQRTQAIAAIRECFEELGILLARPVGQADADFVSQAQLEMLDRQASLADQCQAHGLHLAADALQLLAHWTGNRNLPRRFAAAFFVARMPEGQTAVADEREQFEPVWLRPAEALARHANGGFLMIYPTLRTLERLVNYADVDSLLAACAASEVPLWVSCPRVGLREGQPAHFMEHEAPFGELALVCPDGQMRHALDWQTTEPVRLLKNVQRLTAPNPGFMTGPGTNSYIVGDAASGYTVIDPGPHDAGHIQRLFAATGGGQINAIVCTHSHPDHAPAAWPLQALCARPPPVLGLPSAPTARLDSQFKPDRVLSNQELLVQVDIGLEHTLMVIYSPGHAANHLCLALLEDGLLFTGDHVLNGSTTVVSLPDGDMTAYLDSLDVLEQACHVHGLNFILPAHGYVLADAAGAIRSLRQHRLRREARVLAAMQALPNGSLDDWLPLAYSDTDAGLWPVARHSLAAHVARIGESR